MTPAITDYSDPLVSLQLLTREIHSAMEERDYGAAMLAVDQAQIEVGKLKRAAWAARRVALEYPSHSRSTVRA